MKTYPIKDFIPSQDIKQLTGRDNLTQQEMKKYLMVLPIQGKLTGEFRCPKKGDWYLSGAIPAVYRAPNDLSTKYHICKLIIVE